MRFELAVALKYLLPRSKQLSASIISLISVGVISLVVWLVIVFMSVTEGLEKKWVEELVALNAPLRITPKDAYYRSYYYQIDAVSAASGYSFKTIGEKLSASSADPYDPLFDGEIPQNFPAPDRNQTGEIKDLVKEAYKALNHSTIPVRPQEYEITFGNMRLSLLRDLIPGEKEESFMTQVTYVAPYDPLNSKFQTLLLPLQISDLNNLLLSLSERNEIASDNDVIFEEIVDNETVSKSTLEEKLTLFFDQIAITYLTTQNSLCPSTLFPKEGNWKGCAVIADGKVSRIYIPKDEDDLDQIEKELLAKGKGQIELGELHFDNEAISFIKTEGENFRPLALSKNSHVMFSKGITFSSSIKEESLKGIKDLSAVLFDVKGEIQGIPVAGVLPFNHLEIAKAEPKQLESSSSLLWLSSTSEKLLEKDRFPSHQFLGEGVVLPKHYRDSGVFVGDKGTMTFYSSGGLSPKEQQVGIYVAGFYDPGLMPVGNKLIFAGPILSEVLRGGLKTQDNMLGNGISLWIDNVHEADIVKNDLIKVFEENQLSPYWKIESYSDFEFVQPIIQQLKSDKTLFTLIALIILIVACSNVISMLILLINDKKKEIGILQAMGVSSNRIGMIFGLCGFITGLTSSAIGTVAAIFTLYKLQSLVDLLSFIQGRDAFQTAFYGSSLPNTVSVEVLIIVTSATIVLSLCAGIIPAIKASRIKPAEILRSE